MPYKKPYNRNTVGNGASRTPMSVMGSQGVPAKIPESYNKTKMTKMSSFPESAKHEMTESTAEKKTEYPT